MDSMKLCCVLVLLVVGLARLPALVWGGNGVQRCDFSAIYNFGDSNSDTGGISSAALKVVPRPNGENFFGRPLEVSCHASIIVIIIFDSAAQELKLPFLTVHTWTHSVRIFGMVQILQQEVHQFFQVVIVHSILAFKYPSSNNSNLVQQLYMVNSAPTEFDRQLKDKVLQLRAQLPDATFTYVDVHSAKYALISNAKNEGFVDPKRILNDSLSSQ
ncbi:GDSL esterase/lipase At3g27950-like [Castanea sativa]|uniref:GDSL esterase/lipase At3g27950-like n=1 Tax=Castanea sativa TaxID=21020 RepID=UPI003F64D39F